MTEMLFADAFKDGEDLKSKKVCDPCAGTGRMLMYASNHSLFLYGADIDSVCVMATKVNGFLYMPWMVRPGLPAPEQPEEDVFCESPRLEVKPLESGERRTPLQLELFN